MHRELATSLTLPDVREALAMKGVEPVCNSPLEFAEEIRLGLRTWPPILRAAGLVRE
jgi:tripartite-type tricarboxylate transporter receptor subunit TctC